MFVCCKNSIIHAAIKDYFVELVPFFSCVVSGQLSFFTFHKEFYCHLLWDYHCTCGFHSFPMAIFLGMLYIGVEQGIPFKDSDL